MRTSLSSFSLYVILIHDDAFMTSQFISVKMLTDARARVFERHQLIYSPRRSDKYCNRCYCFFPPPRPPHPPHIVAFLRLLFLFEVEDFLLFNRRQRSFFERFSISSNRVEKSLTRFPSTQVENVVPIIFRNDLSKDQKFKQRNLFCEIKLPFTQLRKSTSSANNIYSQTIFDCNNLSAVTSH